MGEKSFVFSQLLDDSALFQINFGFFILYFFLGYPPTKSPQIAIFQLFLCQDFYFILSG